MEALYAVLVVGVITLLLGYIIHIVIDIWGYDPF